MQKELQQCEALLKEQETELGKGKAIGKAETACEKAKKKYDPE